ncbi:uncharacterized protein LOC107834459 [Poecilia formosa]|uniref:uncharacterized protein LOC107834459 n=1 Tax=Poecilia formosa TaxID=48698 RepID=UPI0007B7B22B|nr:PREDICTED: uncharacterized protein LOC107834459 [Poecilia formosa]
MRQSQHIHPTKLRKVLSLTTDQPNMETLVVHVGANDLAKQKSKILKKDFNILLDTMGQLKMKLFLSGPISSPKWGDKKHSRLDMINKWLIKTCSASSVTFIDNLWIYWQRFHLFVRGRRNLNKHGIKLLAANIFHFVNKNNNVTIASEEQAQGCLTRMEPSAYQKQSVPKQTDKTLTGDRMTGSPSPSPLPPSSPLHLCSYTHSQDQSFPGSPSLKRVGLYLNRLKMLVEDPGQRGRRTDSSSSQQDGMDQQVCLGTTLLSANIADLTSSKPPASDFPEDPSLYASEV